MALRGHLDFASHHRVTGWAQDTDIPDVRVSLVVSVNGKVVGRALADRYRPDLREAAIGTGQHAFDLRLETLPPWQRHEIAVRREGDGEHLPHSPWVLEAASTFDPSTKDAMARVLSTAGSADELEKRLLFLLEQVDQLRQTMSDLRSGTAERADRHWRMWNEPSVDRPTAPAAAVARPRALIIADRLPRVDDGSTSNALLSHVMSLRRLGFDVVLAPASLDGDQSHLEAVGFACCVHPWYASIEEVLKRQRDAFELAFLHSVTTAARYITLVRDHLPRARVIYSVAELLHPLQARQAEIEKRPELSDLSEQTRFLEMTAARQANAIITHSTAEAAILRRYVRPDAVHVVPWTVSPRPTPAPFADRNGIVFIAGSDQAANADATSRLVEAIQPELDRLGVVAPLRQRSASSPLGVARVAVAPFAFGSGIGAGVLDSFAAGIPCVCTPEAVEGLELPDVLMKLVGEKPSDIARSIHNLHEDEVANRTCVEAGLAYIRSQASETNVDASMRAAVHG